MGKRDGLAGTRTKPHCALRTNEIGVHATIDSELPILPTPTQDLFHTKAVLKIPYNPIGQGFRLSLPWATLENVVCHLTTPLVIMFLATTETIVTEGPQNVNKKI
jgi:hypothetical protein